MPTLPITTTVFRIVIRFYTRSTQKIDSMKYIMLHFSKTPEALDSKRRKKRGLRRFENTNRSLGSGRTLQSLSPPFHKT